MALSLHSTTNCMFSTSRPSSATPIRHGKKAESKMQSAVCAELSPEKLTWPPLPTIASSNSYKHTTIRLENVWTFEPRPNYSGTDCCTSNVNPPSGVRRNDEVVRMWFIRCVRSCLWLAARKRPRLCNLTLDTKSLVERVRHHRRLWIEVVYCALYPRCDLVNSLTTIRLFRAV